MRKVTGGYQKRSVECLEEKKKVHTFATANGEVLYGQLPSNPPGPDRSKGSWL